MSETTCTCGRAWEGHQNPHAITCPHHAVSRVWGVASDVWDDGLVDPSSVTYAPSAESAQKKAETFGGVAVTRLVGDWHVLPRAGGAA